VTVGGSYGGWEFAWHSGKLSLLSIRCPEHSPRDATPAELAEEEARHEAAHRREVEAMEREGFTRHDSSEEWASAEYGVREVGASYVEEVEDADESQYAVVDANNVVQYAWTDLRDAGDPELVAEAESLVARYGTGWVYVDGPCTVGDRLDVDEDGSACPNPDDDEEEEDEGVDSDDCCIACGHPADGCSGHGSCNAPCHTQSRSQWYRPGAYGTDEADEDDTRTITTPVVRGYQCILTVATGRVEIWKANGVWAGTGHWSGSRIEDCAADLGDDVYDDLDGAIQAAIEEADDEEEDEEMVTIEEMPDHLRSSHRAAGNWGRYPMNGAERREVTREEAEEIIAADEDGYDHIVE